MPYFYGFCAGFHPIKDAFPRFSTHPNLELIPTHLELFNTHPSWNTHFSLGTSTPSSNSCYELAQTYQLEMLKTVTKTTRVEISTLS